MISVAASDSHDELAYFSNYGQSVDIAAPGVDIYSTYPNLEIVSGETEAIVYDRGWARKLSVSGELWTQRANMVVSGEAPDLSGVLWGDTRTPYVSGESAYIQKTFANPDKDIAAIYITTWCDTPRTGLFDTLDARIDVLVSTG